MQRLIRGTISCRNIIKSHSILTPINYQKFSTTTTGKKNELERFSDIFNNGSNAQYLENLYDQWYENNQSVSPQWDAYFKQVSQYSQFDFQASPSISQLPSDFGLQIDTNCFRVRMLINKYRNRGHERADIDPLKLETSIQQIGKAIGRTQLNYQSFGFTEADLQKEFYIQDKQSQGITSHSKKLWKLGELIEYLEKVYCGKIGYEYFHLTSYEERSWIRDRIENYEEFKPTKEQQRLTFERLCKQYCFSSFLDKKFNTSKRFGIDGLDSLVPGMLSMVDTAALNKVENVVFGMAHRGRLEVLYTVFQKSAEEIMAEFQDLKGKYDEDLWGNSGDVKYHLGATNELNYGDHKVRLNILPNPSHLEAVNPLVYGKVKAIQDSTNDLEGKRACGVLIHGDAAISGQGVVYESFQMADLKNYKSGGIIHVVANNQIGFTTVPKDARSGLYCTDIANTVQAPVFHVNADEPDLVDRVFQLATEFRMKFNKDVVIDVIGYRRFGHNEQDQPSFTQPIMYSKIKQTQSVFDKYTQRLMADGIISKDELEEKKKFHYEKLEQAFFNSRQLSLNIQEYQLQNWEKLNIPQLWGAIKDTGVPIAELKHISKKINHLDSQFNVHPQIKKFYDIRLKSVLDNTGIDFATAEALAFATLLHEGYSVRLSGQDVGRATFSHRHAALNDQVDPNQQKYLPLLNIIQNHQNTRLTVSNSHLSEFAVLGFEYGYSITNPNTLTMWEAQFGDFANGAQVIIDNYIASAETKWHVQSGLTLLLPNGMDGQGPEHSSGRVERFLQLADDDPSIYERDHNIRPKRQIQNTNIQVVQCTTPSNYFHVLRRQQRRQFRKPLIAMVSKKLLRYVPANSFLIDFDQGTRFHTAYPEVYPNEILPPQDILKVIICSGQLYYDLLRKRQETKQKNVAIIRIEQLSPFPYVYVHKILEQYKQAEFYWAQEEHENYGPWAFVRPRINHILQTIANETNVFKHKNINYIGRNASASTATGFLKLHEQEFQRILSKLFD